jgi:hypothetical protein
MPGLVPGIHPAAGTGASGGMDSGDKRRNDIRETRQSYNTKTGKIDDSTGQRPRLRHGWIDCDNVRNSNPVRESDVTCRVEREP